jgi:hypothetical protein
MVSEYRQYTVFAPCLNFPYKTGITGSTSF